MTDNIPNYSF